MKTKILQIVVLLVPLMFMVGYGLMYHLYGLEYHLYGVKFFYGNHTLYGDRKIIQFPFEMVKDLPEEPNWYRENAFEEIREYRQNQKEIQKWFDMLSINIGVVNKSGDPIPLHDFRSGSMFGLTFFQHDGNLVAISSSSLGTLDRMEVFEKSIKKENLRYCYNKGTIAKEWDRSYIDSHNTLYYYVYDASSKIKKIEENTVKADGFYSYEGISYPIIIKDNQIYSYILEGAEMCPPGKYSYEVEEIKLKKVTIGQLQGTCKLEKISETIAEIESEEIVSDRHQYFQVLVQRESIKDMEEGKYDITEIFSVLQKEEDTYIKERERLVQYTYLDRSLGYKEEYFW